MQDWGKISIYPNWLSYPSIGSVPKSSFVATLASTFVNSGTDTANSSIYSFSAVSANSTSLNGYLVFTVAINNPDFVTYSISTGSTVAINARLVGESTITGRVASIWVSSYLAPVPTGSNIVIASTGTAPRLGWGIYNISGSTALSTGTVTTYIQSASTNSLTENITVPIGGVTIGTARETGGTAPFTWTYLTEDFDTNIEATIRFTAASNGTAASTTLSTAVTLTTTGAGATIDSVISVWSYQEP